MQVGWGPGHLERLLSALEMNCEGLFLPERLTLTSASAPVVVLL